MKVHFHSPVTFEGAGLKSKLAEVREGYRAAKAVEEVEDQLLTKYEAAGLLHRLNRDEHTTAAWNQVSGEIVAHIIGGTATKGFIRKVEKLSEANVEEAMKMVADAFPAPEVVTA